MVSPKLDSVNEGIKQNKEGIKQNREIIKDLANEIRADRRAMNQRIDNLYNLHAKKTGK